MSGTLDVCRYIDDYIVSSRSFGNEFYNKTIDPAAKEYYQNKYQEAIANMKANLNKGQLKSILANNDISGATEVLEDFTSSNSYILEDVFNQIAEKLNQAIASAEANVNFSALQQEARSAQTILENGNNSMENVQSFLNTLNGALRAINESQLPRDVYDAFLGIFTGKVAMTEPVAVSDSESDTIKKVVRYLNSAAEKFQTNGGSLKASSFGGTISNIFNQMAGEPMAKKLVADNLEGAVLDTLNTLSTAKLNKNITVIKGTNNHSETTGDRRVSGTQIKTDLLNTDMLSLVCGMGDNQITVEVSGNASIKWSGKKKRSIELVNGAPITSVLSSTEEYAYAHNAIAHNGAALPTIRKGIAASFFVNWLTGSGDTFSTASGMTSSDRVQFLIVNGQVFSVYDVVQRVLNNAEKQRNGLGLSFEYKGGHPNNAWQGTAANSTYYARERSEAAKEVINAIQISATLSKSVLGM